MKLKAINGSTLIFIMLFSFLSIFLVVSLAAAEEKYITYFSNADYTGPIAANVLPVDQGEEDYFKYINEKGGINGVEIRFIGVDTRYDVARMLSAYKRYRTAHKLLMTTTWSTGATKILAPFVERDKIIQITPADGEFQAHLGRTFLMCPPYQDGFSAMIDWIVQDWKSKGKRGIPKIGCITWDNPYGREKLRGGAEYAEKVGVTLLESEYFKPGTLKHDIYLKRLAEKGADYIHMGGVNPTQTNILRDAHQLGLTQNIQFVSGYWGIFTRSVKAHPEALEGAVVGSPYLRGEDAPNHPLIKMLWTKYRGPIDTFPNGNYCMGVAMGINFCNALKIALDEAGYENIIGEHLFKAYQKIGGKSTEGLMGPCTYGPDSRVASRVLKFYQVKNAKLVPITDWIQAPDSVSLHKF